MRHRSSEEIDNAVKSSKARVIGRTVQEASGWLSGIHSTAPLLLTVQLGRVS